MNILRVKRKACCLSVAIDSASFQGALCPDLESLKVALQHVDKKIDMTRSYLGGSETCWTAPIVRWAKLNTVKLADEDAKQMFEKLLSVFIKGGFFDRTSSLDVAMSAVTNNGCSTIQMELLLALSCTLERKLDDVFVDLGLALHNALNKDEWNCGPNDLICRMIDRCTDTYLCTRYTCSNDDETQDLPFNILKSAVKEQRPFAVAALLKRLPGVSFDVISGRSPLLAEAVSLSIPMNETPQNSQIRALIATGELFMQEYYVDLKIMLKQQLRTRILPELIILIYSFLQRMTLAKQLITLPIFKLAPLTA